MINRITKNKEELIMPQDEDNLLDDFLQKLEGDESIEDLSKYILETLFNKLLEREMEKHISAKKYERTEGDQKNPVLC